MVKMNEYLKDREVLLKHIQNLQLMRFAGALNQCSSCKRLGDFGSIVIVKVNKRNQ